MALDAAWCGRNGITHIPAWVDINGVDRARNHAVKLAEDMCADLLYMQDADSWTHGRSLESLIETMATHAASATFAAYRLRNRPGTSVDPSRPGERYLAKAAGTGFVLIDMARMRDVPKPWFRVDVSHDGLRMEVGEDINFCRLLHRSGKIIAVDFTLETSHASQDVLVLNPRNANTERQAVVNGGQPEGAKAL